MAKGNYVLAVKFSDRKNVYLITTTDDPGEIQKRKENMFEVKKKQKCMKSFKHFFAFANLSLLHFL